MYFGEDTDTELEEAIVRYKMSLAAAERAKEYIQNKMGDTEELVVGPHTVKWTKCSGRKTINWKALALELGATEDVVAGYTSIGNPYRRFEVK
jgi:hypothetical protein